MTLGQFRWWSKPPPRGLAPHYFKSQLVCRDASLHRVAIFGSDAAISGYSPAIANALTGR
jgi:hypothetical protein